MKAEYWWLLSGVVVGFVAFILLSPKKEEDPCGDTKNLNPGEAHGVWEGTNNDD